MIVVYTNSNTTKQSSKAADINMSLLNEALRFNR